MFKRLFWVSVGVTIGVIGVTKAQAYVRAHTPEPARTFVFGDQQPLDAAFTVETVKHLVQDFTQHRRAREQQLIAQYSDQRARH